MASYRATCISTMSLLAGGSLLSALFRLDASHAPFQASQAAIDKYKSVAGSPAADLFGDDHFARCSGWPRIAELDKKGLRDNTIIFFARDNGVEVRDHRANQTPRNSGWSTSWGMRRRRSGRRCNMAAGETRRDWRSPAKPSTISSPARETYAGTVSLTACWTGRIWAILKTFRCPSISRRVRYSSSTKR